MADAHRRPRAVTAGRCRLLRRRVPAGAGTGRAGRIRHETLVRSGLTPEQADVVVEAEEAATDRGEPAPSPAEALAADAADDGDTASHAAVLADRQRYRRHRRTKAEMAADKAAEEARAEAIAAGANAVAADVVAHGARNAAIEQATADRAAAGNRGKNAASAESHNVWHIAADWTEAFGPVVYEPVEQRLRAQALTERARLDALRAAGLPLVRPQVLVLDDVPVYGRDRGGSGWSRRDDGFALLAAAEVVWKDREVEDPFAWPSRTDERDLKLRLVRAMPKSTAAAWRLLFDELEYHPDVVVADAGTGIGRAIEEHFDPQRTVFVPSLWHVSTAVRTGLAATKGALVPVPGGGREPLPALRAHLALLGRDRAIADPSTWSAWWDDLERICVAERLPLDKVRVRRRNYEDPFATALAAWPTSPGCLSAPAGWRRCWPSGSSRCSRCAAPASATSSAPTGCSTCSSPASTARSSSSATSSRCCGPTPPRRRLDRAAARHRRPPPGEGALLVAAGQPAHHRAGREAGPGVSAAELPPATPGAAVAALWAQLRLVVIDTETLVGRLPAPAHRGRRRHVPEGRGQEHLVGAGQPRRAGG